MGLGNIIVWNVRGLNSRTCPDVVRELVSSERPSVVYLQETKLHVIDDYGVMQLLGVGFDYSYLPSTRTRGGILAMWKASCWVVSNTIRSRYSVYGPTDDAEKLTFLDEFHQFCSTHPKPWLLADDFNMIYQAANKNNGCLNRRLMGQFRQFLNGSVLKEIHLTGRLFTWSNEHSHLPLEPIDRAFTSSEWEDLFLDVTSRHSPPPARTMPPSCSAPLLTSISRKGSHFIPFGRVAKGSWVWFSGLGIALCGTQALSCDLIGFFGTWPDSKKAGVISLLVMCACSWHMLTRLLHGLRSQWTKGIWLLMRNPSVKS
jgi:hypothetical protein